MSSKATEENVKDLAEAIAKEAGVDVDAATRVLRALNVTSQIDLVVQATGGRVDPKGVKLAYRIAGGGMVA
jgi:hypothetical protein